MADNPRVPMNTAASNTAKFQNLLRELFQFDCADLDFGIYRILNHKRDAIEKFIAEQLPAAVAAELNSGSLAQQAQADAALQQARRQVEAALGEDAIDAGGRLADTWRGTPLGKRYLEAQTQADGSRSRATVEAGIYNHLHTFFSRYYQDGDFISKRPYARNQRYAIPYNGEEVHLHWANRDQYYVKTAEHFYNYDWNAPGGVAVHFRLKTADAEQNNVKGDKRFFLPRSAETGWDANARAVTIPFEYRPLTASEQVRYGSRNQQESIITASREAIPKQLHDTPEAFAALTGERWRNRKNEPVSHLEHHLRQYTRRNDSGFFIHKDLPGFLSRELDFYLKNDVLNLDDVANAGLDMAGGWFQQMRLIKAVGSQIIDFLAQIEGFQKMLWEKRKFVTETQYCITLGSLDASFYPDIAANAAQWDEWRELCDIDGSDRSDTFLKDHPTLVVDTAHFDVAFTDRLLASFDDLDGMTDGLLVHGENWQALCLMQEKYKDKVKCIYIDPPYNSKTSEILYKNSYKHSSWLSLMDNRITISRKLSTTDGSHVIAIDENEQVFLGQLLKYQFPNYNNVCVSVVHDKKGIQKDRLSYNHDFAYFCIPPDMPAIHGRPIGKENWAYSPLMRKWGRESERSTAKNCFYPIFVDNGDIVEFGEVCSDDFHPGRSNVEVNRGRIAVYPVDPQGIERKWRYARGSVESIRHLLNPRPAGDGEIQIHKARDKSAFKTVWDDPRYIAGDYGTKWLTDLGLKVREDMYPKSIHTVMDSIHLSSDDDSLTMDYFAGSGTTGHAVINLNREDGGQRKFILVEMGAYFETVLLPRIKKVTFTPAWKDGKPQRAATPEEAERSPRLVKYVRLESYEDALDGIEFDDADGSLRLEERFDDYLLKYMLRWETKDSATLLNVSKLTRPFTYRRRVHVNGEKRERTVDLPETFNYLLGLSVRARRTVDDGGRRYLVYRGETRERPGREVAVIWRATDGWSAQDFARDRQFVSDRQLTAGVDTVYVNGDSCIIGAKPIEPLFKARLFAGVHA